MRLCAVRIAKNKNAYFADLLFQALQNYAKEEKRVIRLIVSRSEKDLENIKAEFQNAYRLSLDTAIRVRQKAKTYLVSLAQQNKNVLDRGRVTGRRGQASLSLTLLATPKPRPLSLS